MQALTRSHGGWEEDSERRGSDQSSDDERREVHESVLWTGAVRLTEPFTGPGEEETVRSLLRGAEDRQLKENRLGEDRARLLQDRKEGRPQEEELPRAAETLRHELQTRRHFGQHPVPHVRVFVSGEEDIRRTEFFQVGDPLSDLQELLTELGQGGMDGIPCEDRGIPDLQKEIQETRPSLAHGVLHFFRPPIRLRLTLLPRTVTATVTRIRRRIVGPLRP